MILYNLTKKNKLRQCQTHKSFLMSQLVDRTQVESPWSCMLTRPQRLLRTSEPFAQVRKALVNPENHFITKEVHSIE